MEAIVTHKNTDFDGLASLYAAALLYPGAVPFLPRTLNINVRGFLSIHKDHLAVQNMEEIVPGEISRLIVVDAGAWNRLEGMEALEARDDLEIHLWDHHVEGDIRATWSRQRPVGAAVTLLVEEIQSRGQTLSPIEATLFMAGIYEDTGNMTFPSTTAEDARATAYLLESGADLHLIKSILRPVYGPEHREILSEMLRNEKRVRVNGHTVNFNTVPIQGHTPGLAMVMDIYRDITGADASFGIFLEQKRNQCIVIGRSSEEGPDIGAVMRQMGGGGHPKAGSALLKGVPPEGIETWCRELIHARSGRSVSIGDLMSYPLLSVTPSTTMREVALILREKGFSGLPVLDQGALVGIITRRDFRKLRKSDRMDIPVKGLMSRNVIRVGLESSAEHAAKLMVRHDIGRLPVLDGERPIGIVTRSDVMRYYYDLPPD
ncbi:MAG: CBS domain-containing protein [Deltaproteobacteria bacterium]|nr:CBS domain-containing protein [Deltaproteobacteria bacterium]